MSEKLTLMDLIVPLRDEMEGFIARVDEEFLSRFAENSVFEAIALHDEALEREKEEEEPLKRAYLRAVAKTLGLTEKLLRRGFLTYRKDRKALPEYYLEFLTPEEFQTLQSLKD
jgi:hypothetical protein